MKDPCAGCKQEWLGCRRICAIGVAHQNKLAEEREHIKAERDKESAANGFKVGQIIETKKRINR